MFKRIIPDLAGADCSGFNLTGANLQEAILTRAIFQGTDLTDATLEQAHLECAELNHSTLTRVIFRDAFAQQAVFEFANGESADFKSADLEGARLNNARFHKAIFYFANLSEADLSHADLRHANFSGAKIYRADFTWTNLENVHFNMSDNRLRQYLSGARNHLLASYDLDTLREIGLPDNHKYNRDGDHDKGIRKLNFAEYDLSGLDFREDDLAGANLCGTNLKRAIMKGANLEGADLTRANCEYADLTSANLSYAILLNTRLARSKLEHANLDGANLQRTNLIEAEGLTLELLRPATNYMLAIYEPKFANEVLRMPQNHQTLFIKEKLDPRFLGTALEGATLRGANFSGWNVSRISFKGADLSGSIFDGATAIEADFSGANLEGSRGKNGDLTKASFRSAILRHSQFVDSRGLRLANMARADLYQAQLPVEGEIHDATVTIAELSKHGWRWAGSLITFCATALLVAFSVSDRSLIAAEGLYKFGSFPVMLNGRLFFGLVAPLILVSFFCFHCLLQSIWDEAAKLPSVLPSGEPSRKSINPWLLNGMVRSYLALRDEQSPRRSVQEGLSIIALYVFAPAVLIAYWLRYLSCRDWVVTVAHTICVVLAISFAVAFHNLAGATLNGERLDSVNWDVVDILRGLSKRTKSWLALLTMVSIFFSLCAIRGVPPMQSLNQSAYSNWNPIVWGPRFLSTIGVKGRLVFPDEIISSSPVLTEGKGKIANLNGRNLQYSDGRRSWLVGADLTDAKLDFADLGEAHLDNASLQGASLRGANLVGANLTGAILNGTHFEGADLRGAVGIVDLASRGAIVDNQTKISSISPDRKSESQESRIRQN